MKQYKELLQSIIDNGEWVENRTGTKTLRVSGAISRFDLREGFPAVTTKKLAWNAVVSELLWFIEGTGDVNRLKAILGKDNTIWDANAEAPYWKPKAEFEGDLGRVYGMQWRHWRTPVKFRDSDVWNVREVDQLAEVIENIKRVKEDNSLPEARRLIVSAWNPGELDQMALPPCHSFFQFHVVGEYLDLEMYQRSNDTFLGIPFNIASYSLLLAMVARVTGLIPREFIHVMGDVHIYENHLEQVKEQLTREPFPLPELWLNPDIMDIDDFTMEDIKLEGYESHPPLKGKMAV